MDKFDRINEITERLAELKNWFLEKPFGRPKPKILAEEWDERMEEQERLVEELDELKDSD